MYNYYCFFFCFAFFPIRLLFLWLRVCHYAKPVPSDKMPRFNLVKSCRAVYVRFAFIWLQTGRSRPYSCWAHCMPLVHGSAYFVKWKWPVALIRTVLTRGDEAVCFSFHFFFLLCVCVGVLIPKVWGTIENVVCKSKSNSLILLFLWKEKRVMYKRHMYYNNIHINAILLNISWEIIYV